MIAAAVRAVELPPCREWRCRHCNTLLARVLITPNSIVEIMCRKCGVMNTLVGSSAE